MTDINDLYTHWNSALGAKKRREVTARLAGMILAARLGTQVGPLYVAGGSWPKEACERPEVLDALTRDDYDLLRSALGAREHVTLTGDSRPGGADGWCTHDCPPETWVYFERWTVQGRASHGWLHADPTCRRVTQSG